MVGEVDRRRDDDDRHERRPPHRHDVEAPTAQGYSPQENHHAAYAVGHFDYARSIVSEILERDPSDPRALQLWDYLENLPEPEPQAEAEQETGADKVVADKVTAQPQMIINPYYKVEDEVAQK